MEEHVISKIQKVILYETKARFYFVGSNETETSFRVLKIDRTETKDLVIHDDNVEYTKAEIRNLLTMIYSGNTGKEGKNQNSPGLTKTVSAFGIFGFVRFLEGYYMLLITKRKKVALIGPHVIYKIEDISMVYIPNIPVDSTRHPDEQRYVKMFQSVDLKSNFYFSYSYDLTHTLQYNMTPTVDHTVSLFSSVGVKPKKLHLKCLKKNNPQEKNSEDSRDKSESDGDIFSDNLDTNCDLSTFGLNQKKKVYGTRNLAENKFVWNQYLLKKCDRINKDWLILVIHGFVDQKNLCVYGKAVYLALIARRSNKYAGTRFLKRGSNCQGYVANEVETEQIAYDASISFLERTKVTSFVQMRGSIPLHWSQDVAKMVPKPPIAVDQKDPYAGVTGRHFNQILKRYGSPVVVLNLVKKKEKRKHESILTGEFYDSLKYLNQFLPPEHHIKYIGFDMAHVSKSQNVLERLHHISDHCIKLTGLFVRFPKEKDSSFWESQELKGLRGIKFPKGCYQTGIVRTNCVDCLDRTNTAQFAIGKCALALQLHMIGILEKPELEFDTDCIRMLEQLYETQGDTIALQYGGSALVHRIEGYRKIAPWTSHSKDIMHTLSRYYSNTFSDLEKQQALNVFLGVFRPLEGKPSIWDLPTDIYLHNRDFDRLRFHLRSYTQWWDTSVFKSLPLPYDQVVKPMNSHTVQYSADNERVNVFNEFYKPTEFTVLDDHFCSQMDHSIRNTKPRYNKEESPFARRIHHDTSRENFRVMNPNVSGNDSTASTTSNLSTGSEDTSDSEDNDLDELSSLASSERSATEADLIDFPQDELITEIFNQNTYGIKLIEPRPADLALYKRYELIGEVCIEPQIRNEKLHHSERQEIKLGGHSVFSLDSSFRVEPPPVKKADQKLYEKNIQIAVKGASQLSEKDVKFYNEYVYHYNKQIY